MNEQYADLENAASLQGMLGYLNFATGKPDARFQKQVSDAYGFLADRGAEEPWRVLHEMLRDKLAVLHAGGGSAFRDVTQGAAVLSLVFDRVLPAYREHHADLLFHLSDRQLFQPFFLARVCEAVLAQGAPRDEGPRVVAGALTQLNDYVGHRPIAILETRPRGEPYDHERVRPIPLFLRGAGVAWGRYHDLIRTALDVLAETPPDILAEADLDPEVLAEVAVDPRAYDHGHPANRRPNNLFGEWDPHTLDGQGRYCRYVVRQLTLEALLDRVEHPGDLDRGEALFEAAAVLLGTMLMAMGTSGGSPGAHDSSATLATLMPRIARYRDAFYAHLLRAVGGGHQARLAREATATRQPFGGARQHLNQYLARHRAAQLQQRHLAMLFAEMGYARASREAAARIPAASVRLLSEMLDNLSSGQLLADLGGLAEAAAVLPEVEDLLQRGIACGALADPWNILGFQGLFPLSPAREDSVRDVRIDELIRVMEQLFDLYSRLVSEAAAVGRQDLRESLLAGMRRRATWWDRFASVEVSDVRPVHGGEAVASTEHVAVALARWHERGETAADLAFWRQHLQDFQSPKAFALVVEALLKKQDYRAALALLMNWLGQAGLVGLEDGEYSFHTLALRWMLGFTAGGAAAADRWPVVQKFFDYLEANAEEFWQVPVLEGPEVLPMPRPDEDEDDLYGAAYDDVTYQDSADDDEEGSVAEGGEVQDDFDLEAEGERVGHRLRFLSTVARLWQIAARQAAGWEAAAGPQGGRAEALAAWLATARENQRRLLLLLDAVQEYRVPEPSGSYDSVVEYDRRRSVKENLLHMAISTGLDTSMAVGTLTGVTGQAGIGPGGTPPPELERPGWEPPAIEMEQALLRGEAATLRAVLPRFLERFRGEPLLFTALADGGQPRQILRVRLAQSVLRALGTNLPRLGLLRETYLLLKTARDMEQAHPPSGRGVTEFNHLFQAAYQSVVEAVVEAATGAGPPALRDQQLVDLLETLTWPFLTLWGEHSQTLQLSALEAVRSEEDWQALMQFVRAYGGDLFHAKFMTLGNLRGILHRGVGAYLDYLRDHPDPLQPVRLIDDLGEKVSRDRVVPWLQCVLQTLVENYEEYKDYNTTTTQSDYGENLDLLLGFLRLKSSYERHAWQFRPLALAHEVLARKGQVGAALLWKNAYAATMQEWAEQHLRTLAELEQSSGLLLRTVSDRLGERFVRPLTVDRLRALVEPAMEEVRRPGEQPSFARLQEELQALTATPTGVGLDVPAWLRQLEHEVRRARAKRGALTALAEDFFRVPRQTLSLADIHRQLQEWEKPL